MSSKYSPAIGPVGIMLRLTCFALGLLVCAPAWGQESTTTQDAEKAKESSSQSKDGQSKNSEVESEEERRIQSYLRSLMIPFGKRPISPPRVPYRRKTSDPTSTPGTQQPTSRESEKDNPESRGNHKCADCNSPLVNGKCSNGKCSGSMGSGSSGGSESGSPGSNTTAPTKTSGSSMNSRNSAIGTSGTGMFEAGQAGGDRFGRNDNALKSNGASRDANTQSKSAVADTSSGSGSSDRDGKTGSANESQDSQMVEAPVGPQAFGLQPKASRASPSKETESGNSKSGDSASTSSDQSGAKVTHSRNTAIGSGGSSLQGPSQSGQSDFSVGPFSSALNSLGASSGSMQSIGGNSLLQGSSTQGPSGNSVDTSNLSAASDPLGLRELNNFGGLSSLLNTPIPISDPTIRGTLDTAAQAVLPSNWEVVKPAGVGKADAAPGLSVNDADTVSSDSDADTKLLDGGVMRMALRTGPANPLVLPSEFDSVVYVIDSSGSMVGGKFSRVSQALVDAVNQMQARQKFSVILFNTLAMRARNTGYRQAAPEAAKALESELSAFMPVGGTDPTDALLVALQMKPQTIVVLSDGEFAPHVVSEITRLNRVSGLNSQINCIAIGSNVETLQRLAAQNGPGNYVEAN